VVDALDARAPVRRIALQHRRHLLHPEIEVERHAEGVGRSQRAALMGQLGKRDRQVLRPEPVGGALDVSSLASLKPSAATVGSRARRSTTEWLLRSSTPRR